MITNMKAYIVFPVVSYFVIITKLAIATGSPEWDKLLADTSIIQPVQQEEDLQSQFASFPPIPAYEHAIDPTTLHQIEKSSTTPVGIERKKPKRKLLEDPKNVSRRLQYAQNKILHPTKKKIPEAEKSQELKERARQRKENFRKNLRLPGNEEKHREYKASIAEYNRRNRKRLLKGLADGTISKEMKENYEKRKRRKIESNKARDRKKLTEKYQKKLKEKPS
ncbi:uncharacterized protein FA14DRAFT_79487 [Meira miltonrushii]|uniref:Uncharacterized protein n=1 Tax=Meira miltonrushii TaxID=1280837 RepID=A0A316V7D5_9BASI|nr:uncharacterized protein FA14DRAFT_79487 [Meira miltonrushii]PWN32928.1 hypothetical protein FA14DRAFT_79487 [Meira miltonrushii]